MTGDPYLEQHVPPGVPPARVLLVGEVLRDLVPGGAQLGGAPLNVGAHVARLGHAARLASAVGADALGRPARCAMVVKLNDAELAFVHAHLGLPSTPEAFCREAAVRFHWRAVCVTSGARGCALFIDGTYVEAAGTPVDVVHPVGAGDAVTAAMIHGLASEWPADRIASFANQLGAFVATSPEAIPAWEQR